jgi:hypothetical protein
MNGMNTGKTNMIIKMRENLSILSMQHWHTMNMLPMLAVTTAITTVSSPP